MSKTVVESSIAFPSKKIAQIVYDVIRIDPEPKKNQVEKIISLQENSINVKVLTDQPKIARVVVNSTFDAILLSLETIEQFGPVTEEPYSHYESN